MGKLTGKLPSQKVTIQKSLPQRPPRPSSIHSGCTRPECAKRRNDGNRCDFFPRDPITLSDDYWGV